MESKKELLIKTIQSIEDERIIQYLYNFSIDFIARHSVEQIDEPYLIKTSSVHQ